MSLALPARAANALPARPSRAPTSGPTQQPSRSKVLDTPRDHAIYFLTLPSRLWHPSDPCPPPSTQQRAPPKAPRKAAPTPNSWPRWAGRCARRANGAAWRARCCRSTAGVSERYLAQLEAGEGNASVLLSAQRRARARHAAHRAARPSRELGRAAADPPLPRAPARASPRGRRVPPDARLRPRGGAAPQAHRAGRPARRRQDHARRARSRRSSVARSSSSTARSSARPGSACPRSSCSTARPATGASSAAASSG